MAENYLILYTTSDGLSQFVLYELIDLLNPVSPAF